MEFLMTPFYAHVPLAGWSSSISFALPSPQDQSGRPLSRRAPPGTPSLLSWVHFAKFHLFGYCGGPWTKDLSVAPIVPLLLISMGAQLCLLSGQDSQYREEGARKVRLEAVDFFSLLLSFFFFLCFILSYSSLAGFLETNGTEK